MSKFNCLNEIIIKLKAEMEQTFDKSTEFYKQANLKVEDLESLVKMKEVILKNVCRIEFYSIAMFYFFSFILHIYR